MCIVRTTIFSHKQNTGPNNHSVVEFLKSLSSITKKEETGYVLNRVDEVKSFKNIVADYGPNNHIYNWFPVLSLHTCTAHQPVIDPDTLDKNTIACIANKENQRNVPYEWMHK